MNPTLREVKFDFGMVRCRKSPKMAAWKVDCFGEAKNLKEHPLLR